MFSKTFRRTHRRRWLRNSIFFVCGLLILDLWISLARYKTFVNNLATATVTRVEDLPPRARNQKIYIVAQFWTSADIIGEYWANALLNIIDTLGPQNVYLSILSSRGLDNTEELLQDLDVKYLEPRRVPRTITLDPRSHQDEIELGPVDSYGHDRPGWIVTGNTTLPGQKELRRISYLAKLRNAGLEPLQKLYEEGTKFDKILYLNDVMFTTSDVLSLLSTNEGVYDVACSFDFHLPPDFYDTFALRDDRGDPAATTYFPFYRSYTSRHAILSGAPAPVTSCWNGIVMSDASPYYPRTTSYNRGLQSKTIEGLTFRAIPDSLGELHVEGSECCLIHADLIARGQANKGLFMNPAVRVGYDRDKKRYRTTAYEDVHTGPNKLGWITANDYIYGIWGNRIQRWFRPAWWEFRAVAWRLKKWKNQGRKIGEERKEPGEYCIVDEMHILLSNGWKHVW